MKRTLLLESLLSRWCPSVTHLHDEPTPPAVVEPPPIVVVPEPIPPVIIPEQPTTLPPVGNEATTPSASSEPPTAVVVPPAAHESVHAADEETPSSGPHVERHESTTNGNLSVEGTASHAGHEMTAMSWGGGAVWPAWGQWHLDHEPTTMAEHHTEEPEHSHQQPHSARPHSAAHLFVPVFMDTAHVDAVEGETSHVEGDLPTPSHEPLPAHAKQPSHHLPPHVSFEELTPVPADDVVVTAPLAVTATPLDAIAVAVVPVSQPPTVRFHFDLTEPKVSEQRLFGWCSLSLLMLWCGWKMQQVRQPQRAALLSSTTTIA